ncbi:MAG: hypothetical protein KAG43_05810, partial [Candidatus Marithrix sp.]|nr:hypothetical protein [Candidatus Marithrix sp.]
MKKNIATPESPNKHPQLIILSDKIIEKKDDLVTNLDGIIKFDIMETELLEAVEKYTDTLQYLWEFAKEQGLNGFCEVCTFINDNIFECSFKSKAEKKALHKQLNLWPQLVVEYLLSPELGTNDIVKYISKNNWPITASKKHANHISVQLLKDYTVRIIESKNVKPSIKPKDNTSQETSIQEIASKLSSKQIEQAINNDKIVTAEAPKLYIQTLNEAEIFDITALIKDDLPLIAGSLDIASDIDALISNIPKKVFNSNIDLPILPVMSSVSAIDIDDDIMDSDNIEPLSFEMEKNSNAEKITENEEPLIDGVVIEDTNFNGNDIANVEIPTVEEFEDYIEVADDSIQVPDIENLEDNIEIPEELTEELIPVSEIEDFEITTMEEFENNIGTPEELTEELIPVPEIENLEITTMEEFENNIETPEELTEESIPVPEIEDFEDELPMAITLDDSDTTDDLINQTDNLDELPNSESLEGMVTIPNFKDELVGVEDSLVEEIVLTTEIITNDLPKVTIEKLDDKVDEVISNETDSEKIALENNSQTLEDNLEPIITLASDDFIELLVGQIVDIEE